MVEETPTVSGKQRIGKLEKTLACWWGIYGAIGMVDYGVACHWELDSLRVGQCFTLLLFFGLIVSGMLIIANYAWAKWVQLLLVLPLFFVTSTLSIFYVWRHNYDGLFWVCPVSSLAGFVTFLTAAIQYVRKRADPFSVRGSR
jgi:hypothetical protein